MENKGDVPMAAYQIRQGKPQVGHYGKGPGPQDYQAMAEYLELKKLRSQKIHKTTKPPQKSD